MLENENKLHICCGPVEFALLDPLARLYRQAVPETELFPIKGQYERMHRHLVSGGNHLLITTRSSARELADFRQFSLGTHRWKAVARRDSGFWQMSPEKQAMLWGQKAVRLALPTYDPVDGWFKSHPLEHRGTVTASAYAMICLQAGLGAVALMPEYLESWLPASLRMKQVFPDPPEVESVLVFNPDRATSQDLRFFQYIRDNYKP